MVHLSSFGIDFETKAYYTISCEKLFIRSMSYGQEMGCYNSGVVWKENP